MNPELIFWPVCLMAFATLFLYYLMSRARIASVKSGEVEPSVFKNNEGETGISLTYANAVRNQYESPVLFYVVSIAAYVTENVGVTILVLAWAFVICKIIHINFHVNGNNLRRRRPAFIVCYLILIVMWIVFMASLAGII